MRKKYFDEGEREKLCYANLDQFSIALKRVRVEVEESNENAKSLHYPHTSICL